MRDEAKRELPQMYPADRWVWLLFVVSLTPLLFIVLDWNVTACICALLVIAVWAAVGRKCYNKGGFVDPFDLLAFLSYSGAIVAWGVAAYRWLY